MVLRIMDMDVFSRTNNKSNLQCLELHTYWKATISIER